MTGERSCWSIKARSLPAGEGTDWGDTDTGDDEPVRGCPKAVCIVLLGCIREIWGLMRGDNASAGDGDEVTEVAIGLDLCKSCCGNLTAGELVVAVCLRAVPGELARGRDLCFTSSVLLHTDGTGYSVRL